MSRTNDTSNKERKVQDVRDEDVVYKPLLDNIDGEKLINEDNFETYMGSRDGVQGVNQEDCMLADRENQGPEWKSSRLQQRKKLPSSTLATW